MPGNKNKLKPVVWCEILFECNLAYIRAQSLSGNERYLHYLLIIPTNSKKYNTVIEAELRTLYSRIHFGGPMEHFRYPQTSQII